MSCPPPGPHTLTVFSTAVSGPGRGKSRYIVVGYVDHTEIVRFDSNAARQRLEPRVPWMEQPWVELEHPHFWDQKTRDIRNYEKIYGGNVDNLRHYYNQSEDGEPRAPGYRRDPPPHGKARVAPSLRVQASLGGCGVCATSNPEGIHGDFNPFQ